MAECYSDVPMPPKKGSSGVRTRGKFLEEGDLVVIDIGIFTDAGGNQVLSFTRQQYSGGDGQDLQTSAGDRLRVSCIETQGGIG